MIMMCIHDSEKIDLNRLLKNTKNDTNHYWIKRSNSFKLNEIILKEKVR